MSVYYSGAPLNQHHCGTLCPCTSSSSPDSGRRGPRQRIRKPVVGARVVVLDSAGKGLSAAATGSDGRFSFHLPSAGDYRLRISRIGYPSRITEPIGVSAVVSASVVVRLTSTPISS